MKTLRSLVVLVALAVSCTSAPVFAAVVPDYKNVVYAYTPQSEPLWLDLYLPQGVTGKLAVVIFIHGGGWYSGSKLDVPQNILNQGFVVASINYRLTKDNVAGNNKRAARWPAQIHDVKAAVRYVRSLGGTPLGPTGAVTIDPNRIGAYGYSAGGHLVALLGTSAGTELDDHVLQPPQGQTPEQFRQISTRVQAVCDQAGPADLTWGWTSGANKDTYYTDPNSFYAALLGGPVGQHLDTAEEASPVEYIDGDEPPFLIFHGMFDEVVDKNQSIELNDLLRAKGVNSTLRQFLGTHTLGLSLTSGTETIQFFKTKLAPK